MTPFRATSIQGKLTLLVLLTTTAALIVAASQFVLNDFRDYRRRIVDDLAILARITGINVTSALDFEDSKEAARTLSALKAKPHILDAAVYTREGKLFARYSASGQTNALPAVAPPEGHHFLADRVALTQRFLKDDQLAGSIYLDYDLAEVWRRVAQNCGVVAAMLLISTLVALFLGARLQRFISRPILELAKVAVAVSERHDYSARAVKQTEDEIGFLIDCFNGMLAQMEKHEKTLREVNEQLARSETRARAATEAKSQFLANMSHELRTPLNAIIGYSEMLQEEWEEAGQKQYLSDLQKIHSAAKHQLGLINDILDLSKIEAGKMTLFVEVFDLPSTVQEVAATIHPLVTKNANRLDINCPDALGTMRSDKTKVRQVLFNLLSNASKFTERGNITLTVRREEGANGAPQNPPHSHRFSFEVTDTGIGMSPEQLGRLFQSFSQAEASTTRKYGGTGLGLALSKHFCQMMGGELKVSSELGKGSTFVATLPAVVQETQRPARTETKGGTTTTAAGAPRTAVLVIDDEPAARDLVQRALNKEGYAVRTASSGQEGLTLARQLKPSAITLDVMMPGMDGWAVLTALKADPVTTDIPVIMTTVVDEKNLGFALGAADYLIKPIQWERLIAVLERHRRHFNGAPVLVVEDDAPTRDLLRRAAEKHGWEVLEAENGRVGLERVAERLPGIILLDLTMPEMDGFTFIEELRRRNDCRRIPVIVVTAKDLTEDDRRRLNGHVIQILQKGGYSTQELLVEIHNALSAADAFAKDI